jgi:GNAT superfamily N-acetyltransferase
MAHRIVHVLSDRQVGDLVDLYANEFWSKRRGREDVTEMLRHTSLLAGVVDESGRLIAFARVLSDFVYRATLYDVIVAEIRRGEGLGRLVIDALLSHPRLARVELIDLTCLPDMQSMYEKWGFTAELGGTICLRRRRPGPVAGV